MRKFKSKKYNKKTIAKMLVIVFLVSGVFSTILFNYYGKKNTQKLLSLTHHKIEKVTYQFFSDLITDDVINKDSTKDIFKVVKNSDNEIISVDYDMENTYKLLTNISDILKSSINKFENGKLDIEVDDYYLKHDKYGQYLLVPVFFGSDNMFIASWGPKIPVYFHFTGSLLTNIKTKVTEYGFNNALLEIYVTVKINEQITTPVVKKIDTIDYDILINAIVVNGRVPEFYPNGLESNSNILKKNT